MPEYKKDFSYRLHPEKAIDNFGASDGSIQFYTFVKAIMHKVGARQVMDVGAGRSGFWLDEQSVYRRRLKYSGSTGAEVTACGIDSVVKTHPALHTKVVMEPGSALPFADASFGMVVSDMTFEHIEAPG